MDEDELLDDADFDDIAPEELREIEQRALSLTQQTSAAFPQAWPTRAKHERGRGASEYQPLKDDQYPAEPSSDYGLDDEDVINLDAQPQLHSRLVNAARAPATAVDEVTKREQWRQQRYGAGAARRLDGSRSGQERDSGPSIEPAANNTDIMQLDVPPSMDRESLQARLDELTNLNARLIKANEESQSAKLAKAGEIAIVRANHEKTTKEYERRIAALQKQHEEEKRKYKAELEAAQKHREKIETSNKFLEHDIALEADRTWLAKKVTRPDSRADKESPLATPKKNKPLPFRDGFDDAEVITFSPSKPKDRSKPSTPKAGSKRKRPQASEKSPVKPLSFTEGEKTEDEVGILDTSNAKTPEHALPLRPAASVSDQDKRREFIELVIGHTTDTDGLRTLEMLGKFHHQQSDASFSSVLYDHLVKHISGESDQDFRIRICDCILTLWSDALQCENYDSIVYVEELLRHLILYYDDVSPLLASKIVTMCVKTVDLVALPRAKAARAPQTNPPPTPDLIDQIDPLQYLSLLQLVAAQCDQSSTALRQFWSTMEIDFVLVMLYKAQPLEEMIAMLEILQTSVLDDSFGVIAPHSPAQSETPVVTKQHQQETGLVDRLLNLLFDLMIPPPQPPVAIDAGIALLQDPFESGAKRPQVKALEASSLLRLRLSILAFFKCLCCTYYGGHALATHRLAIGRLVKFLHESVLDLYQYRPQTHSLTSELINDSTSILGNLTSNYADVIDMRVKLSVVHGASHMHLVALSRVAFVDRATPIEALISQEAADVAHHMLDEFLSPEEGDAVVSVFSSGR